MPLDTTAPANDMQFPNFPSYLRGVWLNQFTPSYVVYPLWWWVSGTLTVAANQGWEIPIQVDVLKAPVIVSCYARVKTAPTGASLIIDVNKNGVTIFTTQANRPTIAAGATVSSDSLPDVVSLAQNDYLTIDIDQIGSVVAGANLTVVMKVKQVLVIP